MKDPIVQAISEIADALVRRGIIVTTVDEGLLLRLAPVGEQASVDGTPDETPIPTPQFGKRQVGELRKSW